MSFLYPRTISVYRDAEPTTGGLKGYNAPNAPAQLPVASGLPASIQLKKESGALPTGLPGDVSKRTYWTVLIPLASAALGQIRAADTIVDDLGTRYQVTAPYWNSLGFAGLCERMES